MKTVRTRLIWSVTAVATLGFAASLLAEKHTPPARPKVHPRIAKFYPHDKDGDHIEDSLLEKSKAAKSRGEKEKKVAVNLVFKDQITQEQIDAFENEGGEIGHIYKTISYGWNGTLPLHRVGRLPQVLGETFLLVEEQKPYKLHMINATQTGRVRPIWANTFGGSSSGYDGSTNITIGIIDTGVDVSHTDLAGRKVYWYDYSSTTNTTALDYYGHGTHVAGIALGTGAAAGNSAGQFSFTLWSDLSGKASNSFYFLPFALPTSSVTWKAGATWSGGGSGTFNEAYRSAGASPSSSVSAITIDTIGTSPLSTSWTFTPSSSRIYAPILQTPGANGVTDYAITNYISSYPAVGDGFNKFRGVAPGCNWAAAKVSSSTGSSIDSIYVDDALDDMVTARSANKIKVINMSLGVIGTPGLDTTMRQAVNTAVANGIIMVIAAGNDGENSLSTDREIDDPARAAYAITVGAMNPNNELTAYTSVGFTSPGSTSGQEEDYKPDLIAPGGSLYRGAIFATDSNTRDGDLSDAKSNDYTPDVGTSMATPFVAGSAALVIDALEQNGHSWDFNSDTDPLYVKMLLCATATESNTSRESSTRSPTLDRIASGTSNYPQGKDQYEGYGIMNPDAAIEAAMITFTNATQLSSSMGATTSDRRAWARKISLETGKTVSLSLAVPSNGDYDLYLYDASPGTYGKPQILAYSTSTTTNTDEFISFTPYTNLSAFVVVKRISGSGTFTIGYTNSNDTFSSPFSLPVTVAVPYSTGSNLYFYATGDITGNNSGYSKDTGEASIGSNASGKTAWYSWVSPLTGKVALSVPGSFGVEMFTGNSVSALTNVTKDFSALRSSNNFTVTAGTSYHIAVDGTNSNSGSYTLYWSVVSATAMVISNNSTIQYVSGSHESPNPASIIISGMTQTASSVKMSLNNFTAANPHMHEFMVSAPNNKGVVIWARNGGSSAYAFTNLTLTFDDTSTNILPDYVASFTITNGTYHPSCWYSARLTTSFGNGAPSAPYTTNLSDLAGTLSGTWSLYSALIFTDTSVMTNGWTLYLTLTVPAAPVLSINATNMAYTENQGATSISSTATITDTDSTNFNTGNLTVQFAANGASEDKLTLLNQGTGVGQIGVSGSVISYGGTNFGYYTGGTNGSSLIVNFTNAYATIAAVQQLITRVAYTNTSENPSTSTRTVQFFVTDNTGNTGSASKNITVAAVNDAPILSQIFTLTGGTEDTDFTISYSSLMSASDYYDQENGTGTFKIQSVTTNSVLKKNGTNVVAGTTTLSSGESLVWTPVANATGTNIAFYVTASDGATSSTNGNVPVYVLLTAVNDAPTLTTISTLASATEDTPFTISYTALAAAANEADVEGSSISFRVDSVNNGTLTLTNGTPVTTNSTLLGSGGSWIWTPSANTNGTVNAFSVKAWDGTANSSAAVAVTVSVTAVNDPPTITNVTTLGPATEDTAFTITYSTLAVAADEADVENSAISFRVEAVTNGTLTLTNGTPVTTNSTLLSSGGSWIWTPSANTNGTVNAFTIKAWDGTTNSVNTAQVKVTVTASNDAPVLTLDSSSVTYTENDTPVIISTNTSITDVDSTDFNGGFLKVQLTSTNIDGADRLIISSEGTNANQIGVSSTNITYGGTTIGYYNGAALSTNLMTITFTSAGATSMAAQRLISRIAFTNSQNNPFPGDKTVTFTVADGDGASVSASKTITFISVNDLPTISTIATLNGAFEDTPFTIAETNLDNAADDADAESGYRGFRVEQVTSGTLTLNGAPVTPGVTTFWPPDSVVWTPATNVNGTNIAAFTVKVTDSAAVSSNAVQVYVDVTAVNDAPTLTSISTLTNATEDTAFTINYTDLTAAADEVDVEGNTISFRIESSTGTLKKNGTNVSVGTLLSSGESLVWTPASNVNGSNVNAFSVKAWDGALASDSAVPVTVNVASVPDKPSLTLTSDSTYVENDPGMFISPTATLTDVDSPDFDGGSLTISLGGGAGGSDRLDISAEGTGLGQIDVANNIISYSGIPIGYFSGGVTNNTPLVISFTNASATLAAVQQLVTRVTFHNVIDSFGTFSRFVTFYINDGDGATNTSGKFIFMTAVNDAPTLSNINTLTGATQNTPFTIGYTLLSTNSNISDLDNSSTNLSFRIESVSNGTLTKNGVEVTNDVLLSTGESWVWTPPTNTSGSAVAAFVVSAWDGLLASTNSVQVKVNVVGVNAAPVVVNPISAQAWVYGLPYSYTYATNVFSDSDSGQTLSYSISGLPPGISLSQIIPRTFSGTSTESGTYSVSLIATDDGSPSMSATNTFTFTVSPGLLIVTPTNVSRSYGVTNPTLTGSVFGIKNGDDITVTYSTTAATNSPVGSYSITATLTDPNNRLTNYSVTLNSGILTITNTAPSVTITSPTNGASINAGSTNTITATASDLDGTITKVEFYEGTNKLGDVSSGAYSILWTNTYAGTFSLTAVATDNANGTNTSAAVGVTINPSLAAPQYSSTFNTIFYGARDTAYTVEYSTNLSAWLTLTNIVVTNGPVTISDSPDTRQRYYRVQSN